jgi:glycosyltransferase involved in cell wall biosynthesis
MNTVLLNDNLISSAAQRGVARYFDHLLDGVITVFHHNALICSPLQRDYGQARHVSTVRVKGSWRIGLQDMWATAVAALEQPAVVYNAYYGNVQTDAAQVFTVYDMMHELFAPPGHPFIAQKRRCLKRASALLVISESTARDLARIYPDVNPAKIVVTPLGVDEFFFQPHTTATSLYNKPYFLYVGHRTPYKNFMSVLNAFGMSGLKDHFDLRVISPGSGGFSSVEFETIRKYSLQHSIGLQTKVPDSTLRDHYAQAAAFVYPSTYEGFGLPLLEAMASGTLVATSDISSMPEIGGEVAFYFDPQSVESIAACLQRIVALPVEVRSQRITQGIARARTFTWERCQRQTIDVLRQFVHPSL